MEKKLTVDELEKKYLEAEKVFQDLKEQFILAKKEEEESKQAKLMAEKGARYKEVIDAYENFEELRSKYVDDYGYFTFETKSGNDWVLASLGLL
jgi:hypothetical protein